MRCDLCYTTKDLKEIDSIKRMEFDSLKFAENYFGRIDRPEIISAWIEVGRNKLKDLKGGKND